MNSSNAIEIRNMSKHFKINRDKAATLKERLLFRHPNSIQTKQVLKNISLSIKKGETVALIGVNGSGKSTLLKLMTKIIYPNQGTVETSGKLTSLLELGAGFHPDFTGRENIYFNASIFGLTRKEIEKRIDDIIEFSELKEAIDDPIRTYSSGMYMRLAFSVAINVDADILLIDEILAVGDQHFQDKCFEKLKELKHSDKTIIIVTHSLDAVRNLCTRAIWLYNGELKLDGDPGYVIEEYLNQSAADHHEIRRRALESGQQLSQGTLFIDFPRDFAEYTQKDLPELSGWSVSDDNAPELILKLDDQRIDPISRTARDDVFRIYQEQYPGYLDKSKLGWIVTRRNFHVKPGSHTFQAVLKAEDGRILSERKITFTMMEENEIADI